MKNRILKEPITTIIGISIVAIVLVMWYQEKITPAEVAMVMPVSFIFFGLKDSHLGL